MRLRDVLYKFCAPQRPSHFENDLENDFDADEHTFIQLRTSSPRNEASRCCRV